MAKRSKNSKRRLRKRRIEGEELYGEAVTLERKQKAISDIRNDQLFTVEKTPGNQNYSLPTDLSRNWLHKEPEKSKKSEEDKSSSIPAHLVQKYYRQNLSRVEKNRKKNQKKKNKTPALLWSEDKTSENENQSYLPTVKPKKGARKQPKHVRLLKGITLPHTGQSVHPESRHHFSGMIEMGKLQARLDKYRNKVELMSQYPQYLDDVIGDEVLDGMKADMNSTTNDDPTTEPPEPRDNSYVPVAERRKRMIRKMKERLAQQKSVEEKKLQDIDRLYEKVKNRVENESRKKNSKKQSSKSNSSTLTNSTIKHNSTKNKKNNNTINTINNGNRNNNNNKNNNENNNSSSHSINNNKNQKTGSVEKSTSKKNKNQTKNKSKPDDILAQWAVAAGNRVSKKKRMQNVKHRRFFRNNKKLDRMVKQAINPINDFNDVPLKQELSKTFRRAPVQSASSSVLQYQQRKYQALGIANSIKGDKRNKMLEKQIG